MRRLKRVQMHFHTIEGEVVTSTQLEIEGEKNEYITLASLAYLSGVTTHTICEICNSEGLIITEKDGMQWLSLKWVVVLLGLTFEQDDA